MGRLANTLARRRRPADGPAYGPTFTLNDLLYGDGNDPNDMISDPEADAGPVVLGLTFEVLVPLYFHSVRWFRSSTANTATEARLWDWNDDSVLETVVATEPRPSRGMVDAPLVTPRLLPANTLYTVSYLATNGNYAATTNYWTGGPYTYGGQIRIADGGSVMNGSYIYSGNHNYPNQAFQNSHYYLDFSVSLA